MWIRSQNGELLVETKNVYIDAELKIKSPIHDKFASILGTYESREEAKKVLDMIQKELQTNSMRYHGYRYDLTFQDNVFQMPQAGFSKEVTP